MSVMTSDFLLIPPTLRVLNHPSITRGTWGAMSPSDPDLSGPQVGWDRGSLFSWPTGCSQLQLPQTHPRGENLTGPGSAELGSWHFQTQPISLTCPIKT